MQLAEKIYSFALLGDFLNCFLGIRKEIHLPFEKVTEYSSILKTAITESQIQNQWFTKENIHLALSSFAHVLNKDLLEKWLIPYSFPPAPEKIKKIGVISAGNIPLVGFHDMLCVLISGHIYIGKLSGKDQELMKALGLILSDIKNEFRERIFFTEEILKEFDAVIATGSNNSSRYFEYYFGKYPHIIRKNRNSVAVLTGKESQKNLQLLADDIFQYFGLGCRNVSMLYLPEGFDMPHLIDNFEGYSFVINHHKYANNYEYNKAVYLVNQIPHFDSGYVLLRENAKLSSPLGVIHFQYYKDLQNLLTGLEVMADEIQCVVGGVEIKNAVPFGKTQMPELWEYADGVDTIRFLKDL